MTIFRVEGEHALAVVSAYNADSARKAAIAKNPAFRSTPMRTYSLTDEEMPLEMRRLPYAKVLLVATHDILDGVGI